MAGVAGALLCAEPGLGAGLELALEVGRISPSAELVRSELDELTLKMLFGLFDVDDKIVGGTSAELTTTVDSAADLDVFFMDCSVD